MGAWNTDFGVLWNFYFYQKGLKELFPLRVTGYSFNFLMTGICSWRSRIWPVTAILEQIFSGLKTCWLSLPLTVLVNAHYSLQIGALPTVSLPTPQVREIHPRISNVSALSLCMFKSHQNISKTYTFNSFPNFGNYPLNIRNIGLLLVTPKWLHTMGLVREILLLGRS